MNEFKTEPVEYDEEVENDDYFEDSVVVDIPAKSSKEQVQFYINLWRNWTSKISSIPCPKIALASKPRIPEPVWQFVSTYISKSGTTWFQLCLNFYW